jgi:hypothetical protein
MAMKYWPRILQMDKGELTKRCFKWQLDNMKFGSWTKKKTEDKLDKIGMGYTWHNPQE